MHITIDARFWGPFNTGLGRYTENLIRHLLELPNATEYTLIINSDNHEKFIDYLDRVHLVLNNAPHHTLREQLSLSSNILQSKSDLIHFPHYIVPIFNSGKPYVVTIHDIIKHKYSKDSSTLNPILFRSKYFFYDWTVKNAIRDSKAIIVPSNYVKNDLVEWFKAPLSKIFVTYEGADDFKALKQVGNFSFPLADQSYILVVGNAYPYKNVQTVIASIAQLDENLHVVMVGVRDVFVHNLEPLIKSLGIKHRVHLLGFVDDATLSFLYSHALCYVSASLEEGFGIQPLEAMTMNCPVIVSDIPTYREICGNAVLYFPPQNHLALRDAILALTLTKRKTLIEKGKVKVSQYSWRKMAKETHEIYERIVAKSK